MRLIVGRLLLVLLLFIEWRYDPDQGESLLSSSFSSQQIVSAEHQPPGPERSLVTELPSNRPADLAGHIACSGALPLRVGRLPNLAVRLLYILMSLRW